jgi:hypothetical protein
MFAVVVHVRIASGQVDSSREALKNQVIPRIRQAPGFVKGYWTASADGTNGDSVVVLKTKQEAEQLFGDGAHPASATVSNHGKGRSARSYC